MMMPSQTIPVASTRAAGAPKGASNNTSAASRTPMPPGVIGITAAIFASGQAKSQTRSGRTSPQDIPSSQPKSRRCGWRETSESRGGSGRACGESESSGRARAGDAKLRRAKEQLLQPRRRQIKRGAREPAAPPARIREEESVPPGFFSWACFTHFRLTFLPDGSSAKNLVNFFRQLEIVIADAFNTVRIQIDHHFVPHVEPFRMMIHRFGDERDTRHVPESSDEIFARKFPVQFSIRDAPAFRLRQQR